MTTAAVILLIILICSVQIVAAYWLGRHSKVVEERTSREILGLVDKLQSTSVKPVDNSVEESKSIVVDPDDVIQQAIFEHDQMMKKLNGIK